MFDSNRLLKIAFIIMVLGTMQGKLFAQYDLTFDGGDGGCLSDGMAIARDEHRRTDTNA